MLVNVYGSASVTYQSLAFLKWVRFVTDSSVNGAPLVAIEIIAKEH
jgi:hypothetical protein